jgi:hypothetical protein
MYDLISFSFDDVDYLWTSASSSRSMCSPEKWIPGQDGWSVGRAQYSHFCLTFFVVVPIHSEHWRGAQGLIWAARGSFPLVAAIVVVVVMPVVFCAKATEKCNINTKICCM